MAKKFTHNVCGRSFRTRNGLKTHVLCEPIAKNTPAPAQSETAQAQEQDALKSLVEEVTLELMREHEIGFVKANIRARKLVATLA